MRNLKLTIEYDGTSYCGWQIQNHLRRAKRSIQETIEKTLQKILQEKIRLVASGRTDAGVHALAQVANFKTSSSIATEKLQRGLNGLLPEDIVITNIEEVSRDFHSRFTAKSKLYRYIILNQPYPSALLKDKAYFFPYTLNVKLMQQEARCLLGRHDFKSFCASGSSSRTTTRIIKNISISIKRYTLYAPLRQGFGGQSAEVSTKADAIRYTLIMIDIEADGFLYNMVRSIVGTLLEIGRGRFKEGCMKKILRAKDRNLSGPTVPAKGLFLVKVNY